MSGFAFDSFDAGPPADPTGRTLPVVCAERAFVCEHRNPAVLAMVRFRTAVGDGPAEHWWATEDQLGFGRGGQGYFALNRATSPMTRTVETGLAAGAYTDLINNSTVQVDGAGKATITIPAAGTLALLPALQRKEAQ
jgi:alpha-amylase